MAQVTKLLPSYVVDIIFRQFSQKKVVGQNHEAYMPFLEQLTCLLCLFGM